MSDTMTVPTVEEVHEALKRVVAEKGEDYVYEQPVVYEDENGSHTECLYVSDGSPSCLAGRVMHELGVPLDRLQLHEGTGADVVWTSLVEGREWSTLSSPHQATLTARALREAQRIQDTGGTWGQALARFENMLVGNEE